MLRARVKNMNSPLELSLGFLNFIGVPCLNVALCLLLRVL